MTRRANSASGGRNAAISKRPRSAGFTLLELLIVLAVVALAAALVVPNVPGFLGNNRVIAAADTMLAFIREARARAIVRGTTVDLEVDPTTGAYRFADRAETIDRGIAIDLTASLPAGRAKGSLGIVRFYPDGAASGGVIRLAGSGRARTLTVDALTGRIRVVR